MSKFVQTRVGNALELDDLIPGMDYHSVWDNPESFTRHIESIDKRKAWHDGGWEGGSGFSGTSSMAEAIVLSKNGWTEGADKIEKARSVILGRHPVLVKAVRYDIAGSVANVPRAISGNPLNMKALDLAKSRRRPVITLLSSMSANCGVDADAISNRAAVVAALIDYIETLGFSCEVIAVAPTLGGSTWYDGEGGHNYKGYKACTSVYVKNSNQPVDITRLSFGLGHASMFRRMIFADWGIAQVLKPALGRGLGRSLECEVLSDKGVYVIPSAEDLSHLFGDLETAATQGMDELIKSLARQGCPCFEKEAEVVMKKAA